MANSVVVILCEGETDREFYVKLVHHIREMRGGHLHCVVEIKSLKGIGNFGRKATTYIRDEIISKYTKATCSVALCYDTDVFEHGSTPPVDWERVEEGLKRIGVKEVRHVRAFSSIENWFLLDREGLRQYLKLPKDFRMDRYDKGLDDMIALFRRANRVYVKGKKCEGLIEALSINVIFPQIEDDINCLVEMLQ